MLHTQFQSSKASGSAVGDDGIFFDVFYYGSLSYGHFKPGGHHLNKLGKGPLGHAMDQISNT